MCLPLAYKCPNEIVHIELLAQRDEAFWHIKLSLNVSISLNNLIVHISFYYIWLNMIIVSRYFIVTSIKQLIAVHPFYIPCFVLSA